MDFGGNCGLRVCFLHLISFWFYVYLSLVFSDCFHLWVCLLVWLLSSFFFPLCVSVCVYVSLCDFVCLVLLLPFVLGFCLFIFFFCFVLFCFFPFLPSLAAGRILVLWLGVGPEPLRWESRVQDIGSPETSWPHVILISESSPRDLCLNTKTQLHPMASKLQCWTPHSNQLAR